MLLAASSQNRCYTVRNTIRLQWHHKHACTSLRVSLKAGNASTIQCCPQTASGSTSCIGIAQSMDLNLQAYHSGPGPGAGSPSRAFALALMTLLCMQLQHVDAHAGESPSCALIIISSSSQLLLHSDLALTANSLLFVYHSFVVHACVHACRLTAY